MVTQFNAAFDGVFDKAAKGEALRHDAINGHSVDIIETMLEYYNVVEVNDGNRERVKKAIRTGWDLRTERMRGTSGATILRIIWRNHNGTKSACNSNGRDCRG